MDSFNKKEWNRKSASHPQRLYEQAGRRSAAELLLPRNQPAVAHGKCLEHAAGDKIGVRQFFGVFLDPKRLNALSDEAIGKIFLTVGKTGPGLSVHQQFSIGSFSFEQDAGVVTNNTHHFFFFVKFYD